MRKDWSFEESGQYSTLAPLYISKDITLFMAPVSKSVLIFTSKLLFATI